MVIRQRAIQAEAKHERHLAILDAAERLLLRSPDRLANVAEVADEAGLAKGTVYLYFPSKEELLLAVHERNIDGFFSALIMRLDTAGSVAIDDMLDLTQRHMVEPPLFLPLAARCFGMMGQGVPAEAALAFKQRMAQRLQRAGSGLEQHFPQLAAGEGVALLRHSYALIIGLWQMSADSAGGGCTVDLAAAHPAVFGMRYADELDAALRALWEGTVGRPSSPMR
ncbi:MAG: TetR family transcriptional regulator [Betaproteobacteria bacterium]